MAAPRMKVTVFTDGSSRGNPGPGGYGAVLIYVDTKGLVDKMNRDALKRPGSVLKISPEGEPQNKDESEDGGKQSERRP